MVTSGKHYGGACCFGLGSTRIWGQNRFSAPGKARARTFYYNGVCRYCTFSTKNQTPRSDSPKLEPSEPIFCPQILIEPRLRLRQRRGRPVQSKIRAPLFATRTLNATGQSRVTLSLRSENLRAACGPRQEERGLKSARKRSSQGCIPTRRTT